MVMQIKHLYVIARIALKTARIIASLDFFSSWGILRTLIWLLICRFSTFPFAWNHTGIDILCQMPFVFKYDKISSLQTVGHYPSLDGRRWGVEEQTIETFLRRMRVSWLISHTEANMHNLIYLSLLLSFIKILYPSSNSSVYTSPENGC